jgi:hypothetical protein
MKSVKALNQILKVAFMVFDIPNAFLNQHHLTKQNFHLKIPYKGPWEF